MRKTVDRLALTEEERRGITHVLMTSWTGLYAPGLDFEIVDHLGISAGDVEPTVIVPRAMEVRRFFGLLARPGTEGEEDDGNFDAATDEPHSVQTQ
jgi:hypothetical protein